MRLKDFIKEIKRIPPNLINILKWSKVLWNNFEWDSAYLLEIIQYKLSKMKKYFETANIILPETYAEMLDKINLALDACNQLVSRDFETELHDTFYSKYPQDLENWIQHINDPWSEEKKKEFNDMVNAVNEKEKEYEHQLFDTMRDYHQEWWD